MQESRAAFDDKRINIWWDWTENELF